jgi:glucoamylase
VFDMPTQVEQRYQIEKISSNTFVWNFTSKYKYIPKGKILRIHSRASATVRWTTDNWATTNEIVTLDSGLGIFFADLATSKLEYGREILYTFYWHDAGKWEGKEYHLSIEKNPVPLHQDQETTQLPDRDKIKVFLPS